MSKPRFPEEFKIEAVKQVTERGYPVSEVASRLGVSTHSLYQWLKRYELRGADQVIRAANKIPDAALCRLAVLKYCLCRCALPQP
ncbi:transposase [Chromobacterium phragmitis]|nr:transposase [Chromobacterium amazonense]MBM2886534.1 transposase [Chromobacterium amazonense]